ncbi:MAG: LLM class flavin-dependent oxidoreductase, partial [Thermoproteota archaeon]
MSESFTHGIQENKLNFGVQIPQEGLTYDEIEDLFKFSEKVGFYAAMVYDHFHPIWSDYRVPNLECWTTLAALSRDTRTIKIGALVTCNSYRYPSVLAKMVATVDNISNGRV